MFEIIWLLIGFISGLYFIYDIFLKYKNTLYIIDIILILISLFFMLIGGFLSLIIVIFVLLVRSNIKFNNIFYRKKN